MARVRNIKPGFFTNEELAECSPWSRLCFAGLWTIADREGRLEDRPKRIKAQLFAMDSVDMELLLEELVQHGFILRYAVNGRGLIQIIEFSKHQNPHHREPSSELPSPESPGLLVDGYTAKAPDKPGAFVSSATEESPGQAPDKPGALPSTHALPCPLSRAEPGTRNKEQGQTTLAQQAERLFVDQFWPAYPRKVGRENALKSFVKLRPDAELLAVMLKALARQCSSDQWRREIHFIPHPATWLNGKRWEDEPDAGGNYRANDASTPDYLVGAL